MALLLPCGIPGLAALFGAYATHRCRRPAVPLPPAEDDNRLQTVHVAFSSDLVAGNSEGLLASMLSLARHLEAPGQCSMHVIAPRESMEQAQAVVECFKRELAALPAIPAVSLHELRPRLNVTDLDPRTREGDAFRQWLMKPQTFTRLYLDDYLPEVPRVLWLDHDVVVRADVAPLYRMRMRHPIAAVTEWCGESLSPLPRFFKPFCPLYFYMKQTGVMKALRRRGIRRHPEVATFNSGVLLIDLDRWRADRTAKSLEDLVKVTQGFDGDQAAFNIHFNGTDGVDLLDWRWNLQHHFYHILSVMPWPQACVREASILHFSGESKPWRHCRGTGSQDPTCLSAFFWRVREVFEQNTQRHRCRVL